MKKFIKYFTFNTIAIVLAVAGFATLQTITHSPVRIFWQEIVFFTVLIVWLKATNIKIWKNCIAVLVLHTVLMIFASTTSSSQKEITTAYWVSLAICVTVVFLVSKILKIANK